MTYNGDQLLTRTDPFGKTLTYGYDAAGNVVSEADSLGGLTTMAYDGNRMVSQTYQDAHDAADAQLHLRRRRQPTDRDTLQRTCPARRNSRRRRSTLTTAAK